MSTPGSKSTVSANFPASQPGERWRWVKRGLELLRDRGIRHNRRAAQLYRELAWIYLHKIAGSSDVAHRHYKRRLAIEMEDTLGVPPHSELLGRSHRHSDRPAQVPKVLSLKRRLRRQEARGRLRGQRWKKKNDKHDPDNDAGASSLDHLTSPANLV